jgi:hypothetical protein
VAFLCASTHHVIVAKALAALRTRVTDLGTELGGAAMHSRIAHMKFAAVAHISTQSSGVVMWLGSAWRPP